MAFEINTKNLKSCSTKKSGLFQTDTRPGGYKSFFMLNGAPNVNCSYKQKYRQIKKFIALSLSGVVFIMLIDVKVLTIVGISTLMSRINFMHS